VAELAALFERWWHSRTFFDGHGSCWTFYSWNGPKLWLLLCTSAAVVGRVMEWLCGAVRIHSFFLSTVNQRDLYDELEGSYVPETILSRMIFNMSL